MPDAPKPPRGITREEFARRVMAALREAGLAEEPRYDAAAYTLSYPRRGAFDLEAAYEQLGDILPERRDDMLPRLARIFVHPPKPPMTWTEAKESVLPTVVPMLRQAQRAAAKQLGETGDPYTYATLSPHVTMEVCFPLGNGTNGEASDRWLQVWGVPFAEAFERSCANLVKRGFPGWKVSRDFPGVFRSPWDDGYDASRALLEGTYRSLPLRGDAVMVLAAPSCLLVADAAEEGALVQLGRAARGNYERNQAIFVSRPLRRRGQTLEHWVAPPGHPARGGLRFMEAIGERADYEAHTTAVRAICAKQGMVAFLPPLEIQVSSTGGDVRTVTTWRDGNPCAFPEADAVVFRRGRETLGVAAFAQVKEKLGGELTPLGCYPPRHLAQSFPEEWQMGKLDLRPWNGPPSP